MKLLVLLGAVTVSSAITAFVSPNLRDQKAVAPLPIWEYKALRIDAEGGSYSRLGGQYSSVGSEATGVPISEMELDTLGASGWELVSSHLEMETAFPNFAKGDTVEGLKSNVRPQALVLLFKRRTSMERFQEKLEAEKKLLGSLAQAQARKSAAERLSAEQKRKLEEDLKKAAALIWEKHKAEAILDGVIPDATATDARILAVGPESRFSAGGTIVGIQTKPSGPMASVSKWSEVRALLMGINSGDIRVAWRSGSIGYEFGITIKYPVKAP